MHTVTTLIRPRFGCIGLGHAVGAASRVLFCTVSSLAVAVPASRADDPPPPIAKGPAQLNMAFTTANITLGDAISGGEVAAESLEHRVVLLDFWGIACPACIATMPLVEQLHQSLGPAGLIVIGAHTQGEPEADLKKAVAKLGITFPIVSHAVVEGGMDFEGIPHAMLFDHTGRCIARGSPRELADKAARAVQAAPPVVLAGRKLEKLIGVEKMLRDETRFVAVLRKAGSLVDSADAETAAEAAFVIERLTAHAEALLAEAEEYKASDAYRAAGLLNRVVVAYRGHDASKRAADLQREWKKDKQFTDGLRAADMAGQLEALRGQALAQASGGKNQGQDVASMAVANKIAPVVKSHLAQLAGMVRQLSPGSKYAARAEDIALKLGLTLPPLP